MYKIKRTIWARNQRLVWLTDDGVERYVLREAAMICRELYPRYHEDPLVYQDERTGAWFELVRDGFDFVGFKPIVDPTTLPRRTFRLIKGGRR